MEVIIAFIYAIVITNPKPKEKTITIKNPLINKWSLTKKKVNTLNKH
jgi:hypothetical protein